MNYLFGLSGKTIFGLQNQGMLKSTKERLDRQAQRDSKIEFYEKQKQNLKNTEAQTVEGIAKKLEMFHSYEDEIKAARQEYNSSQMLHVLDEAQERAEKMAESAEKAAESAGEMSDTIQADGNINSVKQSLTDADIKLENEQNYEHFNMLI